MALFFRLEYTQIITPTGFLVTANRIQHIGVLEADCTPWLMLFPR